MDLFERFAPFIRDYIYSNGWQELREVQADAAEVIFFAEDNLLICSPTASGKTEAAFFPIISEISSKQKEKESGFSVLYIAPLKALINDQFERLDHVLSMSEVPLFRWHGDVGASHKKKALEHPSGILQITPESLESMLFNRPNELISLFSGLDYIIIDELHSLLSSDRGRQVMCQLSRLDSAIKKHPRRIGLSATLGNPEMAAEMLGQGSERSTTVIKAEKEISGAKIAVEHFFIHDTSFEQSSAHKTENGSESSEIDLPKTEGEKAIADPGYEYIYKLCRDKSTIVFSNSREETEFTCATLRQLAERLGEDDRFLIHHGNLSAALREDAEEKLKTGEKYTVCATVTLELGIDIGGLDRTVQIDSPPTVSGYLQRLGRSGRRGTPRETVTVIREEEPLPNAPLHDCIPWSLIRQIAIIELYREESFIEPISGKPLPLSLLFQQIISLLCQKGEMSPKALAMALYSMPPFYGIPKELMLEMLSFMKDEGYIEKTMSGGLIAGLSSEKLTSSFKFYASFKDSEDFTVRHGSEEIGTLSACPPVGERVALGGRAWEIEETDIKRRLIYVKPVGGKLEVSWPGSYGEIHTKILERMRKVLSEQKRYKYLRPNAQKRLDEAVALALNTGMDKKMLIRLGGHSYVLFPWLGTRSFAAMKRLLKKYADKLGAANIESGSAYITFKMPEKSESELARLLLREIGKTEAREGRKLSGIDLCSPSEAPSYDKYDPLLPPALLRQAFAENHLDLEEALLRIKCMAENK